MLQGFSEIEHEESPPAEAVRVAGALHGSLERVISALPGRPVRPMDLARAIHADKSVAHRLMSALAKGPEVGMLVTIPGPAPLGDMVRTAQDLGVESGLCSDALQAIADFDHLVQSLAGDRSTFDAMMSEWAEDARAQIDTSARQLIFRGMKHVHGIAAEVAYTAFLLHPSNTSSERGDEMALDCLLGIHRVRSGGRLKVSKTCDLRGSATVAASSRTLLEDYCSRPTPVFKTLGPKEATTCTMDWNGRLGIQHTSDVVIGEMNRHVFSYRRSSESRRFGGLGCSPWVPVRRAVVDLLLHRDVFPTCIPQFVMSRTGIHGLPDPNDPSRYHDRIRIDLQMQALNAGSLLHSTVPEVPFYHSMLESQCQSVGWNIREFRGFRVRIEYPIFDSQLMYVIPLPE